MVRMFSYELSSAIIQSCYNSPCHFDSQSFLQICHCHTNVILYSRGVKLKAHGLEHETWLDLAHRAALKMVRGPAPATSVLAHASTARHSGQSEVRPGQARKCEARQGQALNGVAKRDCVRRCEARRVHRRWWAHGGWRLSAADAACWYLPVASPHLALPHSALPGLASPHDGRQ